MKVQYFGIPTLAAAVLALVLADAATAQVDQRRPAVQPREATRLPAVQREQQQQDVLFIVMHNVLVGDYQISGDAGDRPDEEIPMGDGEEVGKATPKLMLVGPDRVAAAGDGDHTLRDGTKITVADGQITDADGPSAAYVQAAIQAATGQTLSWSWGASRQQREQRTQEALKAVDMFLKSAPEQPTRPAVRPARETQRQPATAIEPGDDFRQRQQALQIDGVEGESADPAVVILFRGEGERVEVLACANGKHFTAPQQLNLPGENQMILRNYQLSDTAGPLGAQLSQMAMEDEEDVQMIRPRLSR